MTAKIIVRLALTCAVLWLPACSSEPAGEWDELPSETYEASWDDEAVDPAEAEGEFDSLELPATDVDGQAGLVELSATDAGGQVGFVELPASGLGEQDGLVELAAGDVEQTETFYSQVFGWELTGPSSDDAVFNDDGLSGGFDRVTETSDAPLATIYAADLEDVEAEVRANGGEIVREIFEFPGGRRFHFTDPSGNELAVWSE